MQLLRLLQRDSVSDYLGQLALLSLAVVNARAQRQQALWHRVHNRFDKLLYVCSHVVKIVLLVVLVPHETGFEERLVETIVQPFVELEYRLTVLQQVTGERLELAWILLEQRANVYDAVLHVIIRKRLGCSRKYPVIYQFLLHVYQAHALSSYARQDHVHVGTLLTLYQQFLLLQYLYALFVV